jgi:hypothetical protein
VDYDEIDAIRIRALRAVWKPDHDSALRRIFRWYSEKFHTPLHRVQDLPMEEVLMHWYEVHYEQLEPDERHNLAIHLLETPEERRRRESEDKKSEDEFVRLTEQLASRQKADRKLQDRVAEVKSALDKFKQSVDKPLKPAELPKSKPAPVEEEVSVSFTDEKFDLDEDGFAAPPPKRQ